MVVERIVETFKRTNGVPCRLTMNMRNHIQTLVDKYGDWLVEEVVLRNKTENIFDILNEPFLDLFKSITEERTEAQHATARLKRELDEQRELAMQIRQGDSGIGLVEKALANVMLEQYAPKLAETVFELSKNKIEDEYGKIVKKIEYIVPEHGKVEGVTHEEFETVLRFVMADEPVMLIGPAGTGKNVICKQIAEALNLNFHFSNAVTQEYKLTGFIDANGRYHETEFYKAFKNGGLFMLDEIDASIPEVLVILNAAIANRYFDFPNGKIEAHKDFRVVAAGNTFGLGASYQYVGRNQLDAASLDRFAQIEINYSPRIEESLANDDELLKFIRKFRKKCQQSGINHIVSYRTINRMSKMADILPKEKVIKACLVKNLDEDDINMIIKAFNTDNRWDIAFTTLVGEK